MSSKKFWFSTLFALFFMLYLPPGYGQNQLEVLEDNLVNNPSFEDINACPSAYGAIDEAIGWLSLNFTPDLFHKCATDPRVGVPQNYFGNQSAAEGDAYVGLLLYHERSPIEFIATNLLEPMQKGEKYQVSFKVSWARIYSNFACNNLGILFTNDPTSATEEQIPDIQVNELISEDRAWVNISKTIMAGDDYEFIVIGNFSGKENTKIYKSQRTGYQGAYYYLDDIKVSRVIEKDDADNFIRVQGQVLDAISQKPLQARIDYVLYDINYRAFENSTESGEYIFSHTQKTDRFYLEVKAEGYFSQRVEVSEEDFDKNIVKKDFQLQPSNVGSSIVWEDIRFTSGEALLRKSSRPALRMLTNFLQENPNYQIEISGHTDNQGDAASNISLSLRRAQRVIDFLVDEGYISPKRLRANGYGDTKPRASNDTEEGRAQNRRVEIKIIAE